MKRQPRPSTSVGANRIMSRDKNHLVYIGMLVCIGSWTLLYAGRLLATLVCLLAQELGDLLMSTSLQTRKQQAGALCEKGPAVRFAGHLLTW